MKTLVVTPFLPYPLVFGAAIRLYNKIRMLGSFSDVSLLSYQSWTDEDSVAHLETLCRRVVVIDAKPPDSKLQRALLPRQRALLPVPGSSQRRAAADARRDGGRRATTTS